MATRLNRWMTNWTLRGVEAEIVLPVKNS